MAQLGRCLCRLSGHTLASLRPSRNQIFTPLIQTRAMAGPTHKFWEADEKGGYKDRVKINRPYNEMVKDGLGMLGSEVGNFKDEMLIKFRADPIVNLLHGDYEVVWKFDSQSVIDKWVVTTDRDLQEGKSKAQLLLGKNNTAHFTGAINTAVPQDGKTKYAGYANMRSPTNIISFQRKIPYDWSAFTHLVMKIRGDGRPFQLLLHMDRYFDVQWNDQYHYALFTHGGPYWQIAKIPFSKFYLTGKGRIQDRQGTIMDQLFKVSYLGITLADSSPGPFNLEIDFIGVMYDATHTEEFAYEMYSTSSAALG